MKETDWSGSHMRVAREILGLDQKGLGHALGWAGKQQVSDLERGYRDKTPTPQTALAIECLLRRSGKWSVFMKLVDTIPHKNSIFHKT